MSRPELFTLALALLIALDLVTVATRAGLLGATPSRLMVNKDQLSGNFEQTLRLVQDFPHLQSSLSFFRLILRFSLAGMLLYYCSRQPILAGVLVSAGVLLAAAVLLFWLEWLTETLVLQDGIRWALRLTAYARFLVFLCWPVVALPLSLFGDQRSLAERAIPIMVTPDDLRNMVDAGELEGVLQQGEREMIHSIFELGNTLAREIMVPRIDVLALEVNTPLKEAADAFLESGHSRLPVYEDTVDNVLGLLYAKDLLRAWREGEPSDSLRELLREAYFVPEAKRVDQLLGEMQSQRVHMAIVVDEYGGIAGLVTLEDIVEEILGEIQDEHDLAEELPYEELSEGEFMFQGRVDLDDFNDVVTSHLPKDEADTLGGFIYSRVGRVPASGETVRVDDLLLKVEQVIGRRIRKVHVQRISSPVGDQEALFNADK